MPFNCVHLMRASFSLVYHYIVPSIKFSYWPSRKKDISTDEITSTFSAKILHFCLIILSSRLLMHKTECIRRFQIHLLFLVNLGLKNLPASQEKTNKPQKKKVCLNYMIPIQNTWFWVFFNFKDILMFCSKEILGKQSKKVSERQLVFSQRLLFDWLRQVREIRSYRSL